MHRNNGTPIVTSSANVIHAASSEYLVLPISIRMFSHFPASFRRPAFQHACGFADSIEMHPLRLVTHASRVYDEHAGGHAIGVRAPKFSAIANPLTQKGLSRSLMAVPPFPLAEILDTNDATLLDVQTNAPGPAGSLPLTADMLRDLPSGSLTQAKGSGKGAMGVASSMEGSLGRGRLAPMFSSGNAVGSSRTAGPFSFAIASAGAFTFAD
jgi:hypothetical protein